MVAKAQHSRQFSAHPPKLLILQSEIPPEQTVDRTFSDQQLGRPTGRRHNRKTTPLLPTTSPFLSLEQPHGGAIVVVDLFSTLSHREEAAVLLSVFLICADVEVGQRGLPVRRRICFQRGSTIFWHQRVLVFQLTIVLLFAKRTNI